MTDTIWPPLTDSLPIRLGEPELPPAPAVPSRSRPITRSVRGSTIYRDWYAGIPKALKPIGREMEIRQLDVICE